jgi:hypothetical protein
MQGEGFTEKEDYYKLDKGKEDEKDICGDDSTIINN